MKNPKAKGGSFERRICKKLSEWVSNGKSDDLFWRSAMSGGRATVRKKKNQETKSGQGDVTAVTPVGNQLTDRFVIECKNYKDIGLGNHIYAQGPLAGIWDKLRKESIAVDKLPMLIIKENRKPILIGLNFKAEYVVCLCSFWSGLRLYHFEDITAYSFRDFHRNNL